MFQKSSLCPGQVALLVGTSSYTPEGCIGPSVFSQAHTKVVVSVPSWGANVEVVETGGFVGETHGVLERTQAYPPWSQHQKGPIGMWVVGEVTESQQRAEKAALFHL